MSTGDPRTLGPLTDAPTPPIPGTSASAPEASAAMLATAPLSEEIARLANHFFAALPAQMGVVEPSNAQTPATAVPTAPAPAVGVGPADVRPLVGLTKEPSAPTATSPTSSTPSAPSAAGLYFLDSPIAASDAAFPAVPATLEALARASTLGLASEPDLASVFAGFDLPAGVTPADLSFVRLPSERELSPTSLLDGSSQNGIAAPASFQSGEPELVQVVDLGLAPRPFDPHLIRRDFPILQETVHGRPLIWLDNAATTQKPKAVIDRLAYFYEHENSNIHRAAHALAARATDAYESAREKVRRFINAPSTQEIIFVRGATEGINLVAQSWGKRHIAAGDEIVVSCLEHHANIVPWQLLCAAVGAKLRVAPVDDTGQVMLSEFEKLLNAKTKIVAFTQVSNALGTITPAREMIEMAHRYGAKVLLDGAQAVSHMRVDVQALDCDFFVFSGHKVFGPTGIGAVYGKREVLEEMPPWQGGGNMIQDVTFEKTVYQPPPARFEAGTGNIADAVGLGAALDYVTSIGIENVSRYEHELLVYTTARLREVPGLRIIGTAAEKAGVISFVLDGHRTEDVGSALDREGIAVRSGHHCAQPILRRFGLESTVRPSLAPYNTYEDIDVLVAALFRLQANRRR